MFGIGETEIVLILIFAFMIFGPDKLPGMGRTLGKVLKQFKDAQEGFTQVVQTEIVDPAAEAMGTAPKKPNRNRSEESDEDSDIDADIPDFERPQKKESFAERKQRLARERKLVETAAAQVASSASTEDDAQRDAEGDDDLLQDTLDTASAGKAKAPVKTPSEPAPSAADLYAMHRPQKASEVSNATTDADASSDPGEEDGLKKD